MKCVNCGAKIDAMDKFFDLSALQNGNIIASCPICEECADTVTPMELYMKGVIPMANSDDDTVETSAVVLDNEPYKSSAENPIDGFPMPQGYNPECVKLPCDSCEYYYGEGHMCMRDEVESSDVYNENDYDSTTLVATVSG